MKKKILVLLCLFVIPFLIINAEEDWDTIFNEEYGNNESLLVSPNKTDEDGSKFKAGLNVNSENDVDGIKAVAGNNVNISGDSEYGVFAGNTLNINGNIEKELFVAGNEINFNGEVGRDSYIAGNIINITGTLNRNAYMAGTNIVLSDVTINGNIRLVATEIEIKDNVIINGNIKYNDNANVIGLSKLNSENITTYHIDTEEEETTFVDKLSDFLFYIISLSIIGFVINAVFPKIYLGLNKKLEMKSVFNRFAVGLGILIIVPIVSIMAMLTGIGVPISLIVLALYVILCYIGKLTILSIIGNNIYTICLKKKDNSYTSIMIGVVLYYLLTLIPYIGGIISFIALAIGLGYSKELIFKSKNK